MADKTTELYNNILNTYKKTGKIGKVKPYNLEHAKRVAYMATQNIIKKSNTITLTSRQGTEPLTVSQSYCQLNLFTK